MSIGMKGLPLLVLYWGMSFVGRPLMPVILLCLSAGTIRWHYAWKYAGFLGVLGLASMLFLRKIHRRVQLEPHILLLGEYFQLPPLDRLLYGCGCLLEYAMYISIGFDTFRHGSPPVFWGDRVIGGLVVVGMYCLALSMLWRSQNEQVPVHDLLCRYPHYVGIVAGLTISGYALMFGSRWGLALGGAWGLANIAFVYRRCRKPLPHRRAYVGNSELYLLYHLSPLRRIIWFPYRLV